MIYAADTSTSVEKTRAEIETVLKRFGAGAFGYMADDTKAMVQFNIAGRFVRFTLILPSVTERRFTHAPHRHSHRTPEAARREWEQACRSAWRALLIGIKGKLVAVDQKISTVEHEFLAHIVMPNGRTVAEEVIPMIQESYSTGKMPVFQLALPSSP